VHQQQAQAKVDKQREAVAKGSHQWPGGQRRVNVQTGKNDWHNGAHY